MCSSDLGALADWSMNGGQNRNNEFLLDGAPNNANQGGNNIAYVPPADAVQEFKMQTNSYDAQYGRTAGGVMNMSLKSGTNSFHGTVYEYYRRKWLDANSFLLNARSTPKVNHYLDQYGFEIDGPVKIPGIYNGTNKTFFMCEDRTFASGVGVNTRWLGWGVGFLDLDNDGWADLFLVNGHVYPEVDTLKTEAAYKQPKVVYRNLHNGRFADITAQLGAPVTTEKASRGAAFADFDNDGDIDVIINNIHDDDEPSDRRGA